MGGGTGEQSVMGQFVDKMQTNESMRTVLSFNRVFLTHMDE